MSLLLKSATIVDPNAPLNGKKMDILIEKGKITKIAKSITSTGKTVTLKNMHVSPGWFDMRANFCDPGLEDKEDFDSGRAAAAKGGFTGVCCTAETAPTANSKSQIEYVINKTKGGLVDIHPYGNLSDNQAGANLAELNDMQASGAIAFSDGKHTQATPTLTKKALLYLAPMNGLTCKFAFNHDLGKGQMSEGKTSTSLGLHGIPHIAETTALKQELEMVAYTEGRMHFNAISTGASVDLIKDAKKNGLQVSCDVAAHQLMFTDEALIDFDSNLKVLPPYRTGKDQKALLKGLKNGHIDIICSDHTPEYIENKFLEFDHAAFGQSTIETTYSTIKTAVGEALSEEDIVTKIAVNPRKVLGLEVPTVEVGQKANLTVFDPKGQWTVDKKEWKSKSKNSPLFGRTLDGLVYGIINGTKHSL